MLSRRPLNSRLVVRERGGRQGEALLRRPPSAGLVVRERGVVKEATNLKFSTGNYQIERLGLVMGCFNFVSSR